MQNDLISRSALIEALHKKASEIETLGIIPGYTIALNVIKEQPTAYDVEKVDEQLDDLCFTIGDYAGFVVDAEQVSELIRNGGKE